MRSAGRIDTVAKLARRKFLGDTARMACGAGLAGLLLGLSAQRSRALPAEVIRPPGAVPEEDFAGACMRCGLCVRDCPYDTLRLAKLGEEPATGTPYFIARQTPCEMCEDIPCVAACPSGALAKSLTDIDEARMGTAVLVGHETCLNYLGLRCDVCYSVCPLMREAITLEQRHDARTGRHAKFIPVVHTQRCTGCGKCEKACVLEEAAIKVFPRRLARGRLGAHYRLGWEEKAARGRSLIPDQFDLPDRLPEFKP